MTDAIANGFHVAGECMAIEKHYNVKQLIELLGWTRQRIYKKWKDHPLVLLDGTRIFVPASVVEHTIHELRLRGEAREKGIVKRGPKPQTRQVALVAA